MSQQEQPRRSPDDHKHQEINYGEVFNNVSGELASKPVTPRDAATLQSVEAQLLGRTPKGGPAAAMESAAARNERAGVVGPSHVTDLARNEGVTISEETNEDGNRLIIETLGGQVVGQFMEDDVLPMKAKGDEEVNDEGAPTSVQAPQVKATQQGRDFISNQGVEPLNPPLSANQDHDNTPSNVSMENRGRGDSTKVISSVPGGMGASMATAYHRLKKNK